MRPAHNSCPNGDAPRNQAAQAVAMGQTASRTLQSCMRKPPRCGLHNGPDWAALAPHWMPASSTTLMEQEARERSRRQLALSFSNDNGILHASNTLIHQVPRIFSSNCTISRLYAEAKWMRQGIYKPKQRERLWSGLWVAARGSSAQPSA